MRFFLHRSIFCWQLYENLLFTDPQEKSTRQVEFLELWIWLCSDNLRITWWTILYLYKWWLNLNYLHQAETNVNDIEFKSEVESIKKNLILTALSRIETVIYPTRSLWTGFLKKWKLYHCVGLRVVIRVWWSMLRKCNHEVVAGNCLKEWTYLKNAFQSACKYLFSLG